MKRFSMFLLCALLLVSWLTGCGGGTTTTGVSTTKGDVVSGENSNANSNTATTGKNSLVVALINEPTQLDPQYSADSYGSLVILNTHDPLVRRSSTGDIVPCIAESWETADDGTSITFKIRQGVKFQDGSSLTADDVAFSLNRAIEKYQSDLFTASFKEARVIDDTHVILDLLYADIAALALLTNGNNCIVSKAIVESVGDENYTNAICGTGPYKLLDWTKGSKLTFEANGDYWKGAPPVKNLELRILKEATTALVALQTGDVDQVFNLGTFDLDAAKQDAALAFQEIPSTTIWSIGFNCNMEPMNNPKVRMALTMAINKDDVILGALDGAGFRADCILPDNTAGHPGIDKVQKIPFDVEGAKALLTEAGYPGGAGLNVKLYVREDQTKKVGNVVQSQWSAIGVNTEIIVMERSAMLSDMEAGKLMAYTIGNVSLTSDASFLMGTLDTRQIPVSNKVFFSDPEYDKLNDEQALLFKDPEARKEVVGKMINIEATEAPRALIYYPTANTAYNKDLYVECFPTMENYNFSEQYWK